MFSDLIKKFFKIFSWYPETTHPGGGTDRQRFWIGPLLAILVSAPDDVEIVLNKCLNKGIMYAPLKNYFGNGLLTASGNNKLKWNF